MSPRSRRQARVQKSREVFRGRVFTVRQDVVVEPAPPRQGGPQQPVVREVVKHGGSVVVVPVLADGRIVLVRQYRYAVGGFLWELVAGGIDPGESPRAAARRELEEETGYRARHLRRLLRYFPTPGFLTEEMHLYCATGLRSGRARPEADESLETRAFRQVELERLLRRGELRDGKTLIGLLWLWRGRDAR